MLLLRCQCHLQVLAYLLRLVHAVAETAQAVLL